MNRIDPTPNFYPDTVPDLKQQHYTFTNKQKTIHSQIQTDRQTHTHKLQNYFTIIEQNILLLLFIKIKKTRNVVITWHHNECIQLVVKVKKNTVIYISSTHTHNQHINRMSGNTQSQTLSYNELMFFK